MSERWSRMTPLLLLAACLGGCCSVGSLGWHRSRGGHTTYRVVPLAAGEARAFDEPHCRRLCGVAEDEAVTCELTDEAVTEPVRDAVVRCESADPRGAPRTVRIATARRWLPEDGRFTPQQCRLWCAASGLTPERCEVEVPGAPEPPPPNLHCTVTSPYTCSGGW